MFSGWGATPSPSSPRMMAGKCGGAVMGTTIKVTPSNRIISATHMEIATTLLEDIPHLPLKDPLEYPPLLRVGDVSTCSEDDLYHLRGDNSPTSSSGGRGGASYNVGGGIFGLANNSPTSYCASSHSESLTPEEASSAATYHSFSSCSPTILESSLGRELVGVPDTSNESPTQTEETHQILEPESPMLSSIDPPSSYEEDIEDEGFASRDILADEEDDDLVDRTILRQSTSPPQLYYRGNDGDDSLATPPIEEGEEVAACLDKSVGVESSIPKPTNKVLPPSSNTKSTNIEELMKILKESDDISSSVPARHEGIIDHQLSTAGFDEGWHIDDLLHIYKFNGSQPHHDSSTKSRRRPLRRGGGKEIVSSNKSCADSCVRCETKAPPDILVRQGGGDDYERTSTSIPVSSNTAVTQTILGLQNLLIRMQQITLFQHQHLQQLMTYNRRLETEVMHYRFLFHSQHIGSLTPPTPVSKKSSVFGQKAEDYPAHFPPLSKPPPPPPGRFS